LLWSRNAANRFARYRHIVISSIVTFVKTGRGE